MRSKLPQCARLTAFAIFAAACSAKETPTLQGPATVNVLATCSANQVRVAVDPSTVRFRHTGGGQGPTDVEWTLDPSSSVDVVSVAPDAAAWPLDGTPPFQPRKGTPYRGRGKSTQTTGHYRYSVTVACPNGLTAIFDPDIWVD